MRVVLFLQHHAEQDTKYDGEYDDSKAYSAHEDASPSTGRDGVKNLVLILFVVHGMIDTRTIIDALILTWTISIWASDRMHWPSSKMW